MGRVNDNKALLAGFGPMVAELISDRFWDSKTSKFLNTSRAQRREHSSSESSEDESMLQREIEKGNPKRMRLESSRPMFL